MANTAKKKLNEVVHHHKIFLRLLTPKDVSENYAKWIKDPQVIRYMADRERIETIKKLREYVQKLYKSSNDYLFGIHAEDTQEHIGNIKIGNIDYDHMYADIGILIGENNYRGKGYGTLAIIAVTNFAFARLKLNKLFATIAEPNKPSLKAFLNAGYQQVGTLHKHRLFEGNFTDLFIVEKLK